MDLDPDRELQRIHSLFIAHMERLDRLRCNYTAHAHTTAFYFSIESEDKVV
jgi:hypothetical protein